MQSSEFKLSNINFAELLNTVTTCNKALQFQARGFSMCPLIRDGDFLTITPFSGSSVRLGMVVAFNHSTPDEIAVHRVIGKRAGSYLIKGDNVFGNDGWIMREKIIGYVSRIERDGKKIFLGLGEERIAMALLSRIGFFYCGCRLASIFRRLR